MSGAGIFAGTAGPVDVTVVVVTYNSADDVDDLLSDLRREACENIIRVVVVDNDSSDGTAAAVAEHEDVQLISSGGNLGYAGGINIARRHTGDCRALLVLNPDLRVRPGAVGTMLNALDHSSVGVVVPRMVDRDGATYPSLRSEPSVLGALGDSMFGRRLVHRRERWSEIAWNPRLYERPHEIDWATGAALMIRADVVQTVGDWDETYFLYSEEVDFLRRVRESGSLVWYEPRAVVAHHGAGSGQSPELATLMAVNRIRYFRRYHGAILSSVHRSTVVFGELLRSYEAGHRKTLRVVTNRARWAELPKAAASTVPVGGVSLGAVIVPAHNEAAVIDRTLEPLAAAAASGVIELVVVCNGCTDETADIARAHAGVTVVETDQASKSAALNLGDSAATLWPRLYLDADITITLLAVAQVLAELRSGSVLAARPSSCFDVTGSDAVVRSYYRARSRIGWFRTALWGAGAYGLSEAGHDRIGPFPELTGDDLWVDAQFTAAEKCVVDTDPAAVTVPRDRHSLLHMLRRVYRGKAELPDLPGPGRTVRAVLGTMRGPRTAWDAAIYTVLTLVARHGSSQSANTMWERDDSTRRATPV